MLNASYENIKCNIYLIVNASYEKESNIKAMHKDYNPYAHTLNRALHNVNC